MNVVGRNIDQAAPAPRFNSYTTRAFARVYRFGAEPLDIVGAIENGQVTGPGALTSMTTTKSVSSLSGTFNFNVNTNGRKIDFASEVKAGDWVALWWQRNDKRFHGMLGNIDGVRETTSVANAATTRSFVINGRDAGKILETAEVWFNEYCDFGSNVGGKIFGRRMNYIPGGSPDRVVENLLDAFLGAAGNVGGAYRWPRGLRDRLGAHFVQGLKMRILGTIEGRPSTFDVGDGAVLTGKALLRGELVDEISLFQPAQGTKLAGMLQQWSNPILNEMFIDSYVEDDRESPVEAPKPMLYLRERPFPNTIQGSASPWWRLPTARVLRHEVDNLDLGTSDDERINLFMLYARNATITQQDQYAAYPPVMDIEDARDHGLRRWERQIDFGGVGSNGDGVSWGKEIETWNQLLISWYGLNHEWRNGSASFKWLFGEARAGQRLLIEGERSDDRTQAYIQSVTHSWSFPNGGSTQLALTRGFVGDDAALTAAVAQKAARFELPPSAPARLGDPNTTVFGRGVRLEALR